MSLRQRAARGVLWSGVQSGGSNAINAVVLFVLARLLEPDMFGLLALATAFTAFVNIFQRQGLGLAIIQREKLEPGHLDTAFWAGLVGGVLLTGVGIAVAGPVAAFYHEPRLAPVIRWLSLSFILGSLSSVQMALLQRELAFKGLAARSLVMAAGGGGVAIVMAWAGCGVWSLVGQQLAGNFFGVLVLWRASRWRPGRRVTRRYAGDLFGFGANVVGLELLNYVNRRAGDLLIGYFLGAKLLGYYALAYNILLVVVQLVTQTLASVTMPTFSRLQQSLPQMRHAFLTATRLTSLAAFPVFLGMAVLAPELFVILSGAGWERSVPVLRVLALVGIQQAVTFSNVPVMIAVGKPSWATGITGVHAIANVVALLIAVRYGIVAVAAAYVVRTYLLTPLPFAALRRLIALDLGAYLGACAVPAMAALAMTVVVTIVRHFAAPVLTLHVLAAVCTFAGAVVYLGAVTTFAPARLREVVELTRVALAPQREQRA